MRLVKSPVFSAEEQGRALAAILDKLEIEGLTKNFLLLVAKNRRLFAKLDVLGEPADVYPDGIKLGPDGRLYVGLYSAPVILVLDAEGKLVRRLTLPTAAAPNLTFTPDGRTIFVMAVDDKSQAPYKGKVFSVVNPAQ